MTFYQRTNKQQDLVFRQEMGAEDLHLQSLPTGNQPQQVSAVNKQAYWINVKKQGPELGNYKSRVISTT